MKNLVVIIISILFFSCKKEEKIFLIGEWTLDSIIDYGDRKDYLFAEDEFDEMANFKILNDSIIEFKAGFFDYLELTDRIDKSSLSALYYLGTQTKYSLKNSLLIFYNKNDNKKDTIKILKSDIDKISIQFKNKVTLNLKKINNKYFNSTKYDAVVVDRSPCFGRCSFNFTYIDRQGNYYFKNKGYNTIDGNIATKVSQDKIDYYFNIFDKIDIEKFQKIYQLSATDGQSNAISFFKNGKVVKTISTYLTSPIELKNVINELSYAYQSMPDEIKYYSVLGDDYLFGMQFKNNNLRLLDSESDFLEVSLIMGKQVEVDFEPKYEMQVKAFYSEGPFKKIFTDGRYYKFINKDDSFFTVDLGYNFIELNPILKEDRYN